MNTPFSYQIDAHLARLTAIAKGTVTADDLTEHLHYRESNGVMEYDQLIDLRQAKMTIEVHETDELAHSVQFNSNLGRTAIVVADLLSFGMARVYASLSCPEYTANVFRSLDEATEWLGWSDSHSLAV
jgi:hypothetical protein